MNGGGYLILYLEMAGDNEVAEFDEEMSWLARSGTGTRSNNMHDSIPPWLDQPLPWSRLSTPLAAEQARHTGPKDGRRTVHLVAVVVLIIIVIVMVTVTVPVIIVAVIIVIVIIIIIIIIIEFSFVFCLLNT